MRRRMCILNDREKSSGAPDAKRSWNEVEVVPKKSSFFAAPHLTFFLFAPKGCSYGGSKEMFLVSCGSCGDLLRMCKSFCTGHLLPPKVKCGQKEKK